MVLFEVVVRIAERPGGKIKHVGDLWIQVMAFLKCSLKMRRLSSLVYERIDRTEQGGFAA